MPRAAIHRAEMGDAPAIAGLHALLFDPPWDAAAVASLMAPPAGLALVAISAPPSPQDGAQWNRIAGFVLARVAADEAEILSVAVAAGMQRQGIARQLLEQAMRELDARGARRLFLEVAADNAPALTLYAGLCLVEVGRRSGYYARPGTTAVDALVLARDL